MQRPVATSVAATGATLVLLMLIAGCGQKGPLFLPAPATAASAGAR
jgi:predicted small lipoprotein YifL